MKMLLSDFNVDSTVTAGTDKVIEFVASKTGTFDFKCGAFCVTKYGQIQGDALKGKLTVK